jgi:hypothetical protein
MKNLLLYTVRLGAIASLFSLTIPSSPTLANQFSACTRQMINSGITAEAAGDACADALIPTELSACVRKIKSRTAIAPEDALQACYRVRRPNELASCVVDINAQIPSSMDKSNSTTETDEEIASTTMMAALNDCRKSLLPRRYSDCVIGISKNLPLEEAMDTCLSAEAYPKSFFPAY